ncbi:cohesin domain-containing protein [Paenibacillus peoriae]|uniref:cohesin domain-containing protein n=1 Tax=Paenibacillus peoriae TaxID=59893 RepID=UPI00026C58B3|nr:cohesin domain-containing protein [Paenibacillus peoriae]MEC0181979.1 cohesin domain-containing protein [Paenibacillus peoriae]
MNKKRALFLHCLVLIIGFLILPKAAFAASVLDNQMTSNPFNRGSISSGQWVDSIDATILTATWSNAWTYDNSKKYEIATNYNIMQYGTNYYAQLDLGLMRVTYSRDGESAVYVRDGQSWITHKMTTKGNYTWKLVYSYDKTYQVYRNSVLVASGAVKALPSSGVFSIASTIGNEKVSIDYITINDENPSIDAPANLTANATGKQIQLNWDTVTSATNYTVSRSVYSSGPYEEIRSGVTANTYIDTTAQPGTTYYYVVTATNGDIESKYSNEASATVIVKNTDPVLDVAIDEDTVKIGQEFVANISLKNVEQIYAEDFTITYDTTLFKYVGYEEVTGYKVYYTPVEQSGSIRFIIASQGEKYGISKDTVIVKLKFKAINAGTGNVDALKGRIADTEQEYDLDEKNCLLDTITVKAPIVDVNRSAEYTLVDLAIDGYYFGKAVAETNTTLHNADQVTDGYVNDEDLVYIVNEILNNANYKPNL